MNLIILAASIAIFLKNFTDGTPINVDLLQNLPSTLSTIQEKLMNLENLLTIQCDVRINEKFDYYAHKIDNIEKTISKLEVTKQERTLEKVESLYETIHYKITALQEQMDSFKSEIKNTEEVITTKLDKIEENLTIRDSDIEGELNEAVVAIEDIKMTCSQVDENVTNQIKTYTEKISKHSEELNKYYMQSHVDTNNVQEILNIIHNQTLSNAEDIAVVKESVKNYGNKLIHTHSDLQQKTDFLDTKLQGVAVVTNLSRSELQNNLRSLMVQLGRLTGKPHIHDYNDKLDELNKKLDINFENILLSQNFFLESCHRVQMDEEQIESQISIVLNKLLDIFENNTSTTQGNELQNILQEITNNFDDQKQELEKIYTSLQELVNSKNPILLETILKVNQNLQRMFEKPPEIVQQNNLNDSKVIENIISTLNNIEVKIDNCGVRYNLNQTKQRDASNTIPSDVEKWSFNRETESGNLVVLCNLQANCIKIFNSTYIIAGEKGNNYTVVICIPHYLNSIGSDILNCTMMKHTQKECLPSYIDLINNQFNREDFIKCINVKNVHPTESPSNLLDF